MNILLPPSPRQGKIPMKRLAFLLLASLWLPGILHAEGAAELEVTDRLGRPLKAPVCAVREGGCTPLTTRPIPISGTDIFVRITAPGFATLETRLVAGEQTVKLKALGSVSAALVSSEKNQEWLAEISLSRDEGGRRGKSLETKKALLPKAPEAKAVTFEDVPVGDYWLGWEGPQIASEAVRVTVKEPTSHHVGTHEVRGGLIVRGFVRDTAGAPIQGAQVRLSDPSRVSVQQSGWKAETSSSGEFTFVGLPIATLRFTASAKGFVTTTGTWSGEGGFDITLERAQLIRGKVVNERNDPIPGVQIWARYRDNRSNSSATVQPPGTDGAFELFRSSPGDLTLRFSSQGYLIRQVAVPVSPDKEILDLGDVVLARGRTITGVVLDAKTGQALHGASVSVPETTASTLTGEDGRFSLGSVPNADVTLLASNPGYARQRVPVSKESSEARVLLTHGGTLKIRVCGNPAELAELGIRVQPVGAPTLQTQLDPNGKGEFELGNVSPGEHHVGIQWTIKGGSGFFAFASASLTSNTRLLVEDGLTASVAFRCEGFPVAGDIRRDPGSTSPIWGVLATEDDRWISEFRVDESGRFSTRVPSAGRYLFHVFFPDSFQARPGEFCTVPEGGKTDCTFTVTNR